MADCKYSEIVEYPVDAAFGVHGTLGNSFQEAICGGSGSLGVHVALIICAGEFEMPVYHMEKCIGTGQAGFFAPDEGCIELKPVIMPADVYSAPANNYWKAYHLKIDPLLVGRRQLAFHRSTNKNSDLQITGLPGNPIQSINHSANL